MCMMIVLLPAMLFAMYERNGQPLEVVLRQIIRNGFTRPKNRPYQTDNFYSALIREENLKKEVKRIVQTPKAKQSASPHKKTDQN